MANSDFFPTDYSRLPQLSMGIELELDFSFPRAAYTEWLATKPEIPSTNAGKFSTREETINVVVQLMQSNIQKWRAYAIDGTVEQSDAQDQITK